mmetsp:Transcript_121916/g.171575  ORF Transcript_121916/g.171575 Transcript_121916/m.171575 type:complete len:228 (-) Transcript_121916:31-714(-)
MRPGAPPQSHCHSFTLGEGSRLTPEQRRAVSGLKAALRGEAGWTTPQQLLGMSALPTGFRAFSSQPIKSSMLPRGQHWSWNQSSKSITHSVNNIQVKLVKVTPRLKKQKRLHMSQGGEKAPPLKVWLITMDMTPKSYYLWVERGDEDSEMVEIASVPRPASDEPLPVSAFGHDIPSRGFGSGPLQLPLWLPSPTTVTQPTLTEQSLQFLGEWLPENMLTEEWTQGHP